VIQCDTLSADTWWSGRRLGEHARHWTRLLTDGKGVYCTSQQEDNAVLNALTRGSRSGLVDLRRVAVIRSGSDFDRPYPHQSVLDSMRTQRALSDAVTIAAVNLVHAGMPLVDDIIRHWDAWQGGVPSHPAP
jgi:purine nucleoside permease